MDRAKIYAENAIRKHNEGMNYLKLSARMDAVAGRLKSMQNMKSVGKEMTKVSKSLGIAIKSMNLEKMTSEMDKFESMFEDLDVATDTMNTAMDQGTHIAKERNEVEDLMSQIADEHG